MEIPNLEKPISDSDAQKIAEAANLRKETPEGKELGGKELVQEAVQNIVQAAPPMPPSAKSDVTQNPLTDYTKNEPEEVKAKIESLLQVAAKDGIMKASAQAANASPFILDAFHDALASKIYPYLKERGLLK